jgi:hypothetical protein
MIWSTIEVEVELLELDKETKKLVVRQDRWDVRVVVGGGSIIRGCIGDYGVDGGRIRGSVDGHRLRSVVGRDTRGVDFESVLKKEGDSVVNGGGSGGARSGGWERGRRG